MFSVERTDFIYSTMYRKKCPLDQKKKKKQNVAMRWMLKFGKITLHFAISSPNTSAFIHSLAVHNIPFDFTYQMGVSNCFHSRKTFTICPLQCELCQNQKLDPPFRVMQCKRYVFCMHFIKLTVAQAPANGVYFLFGAWLLHFSCGKHHQQKRSEAIQSVWPLICASTVCRQTNPMDGNVSFY